ncbi:uncharacterized protein (DUF849 family) [Bradyrhizobium sp. LM2.9]
MISEVFITCALTDGGNGVERNPHVPVSPEQIEDSAIGARKLELQWCTSMCAMVLPGGARVVQRCIGGGEVDSESRFNPVINLTAGMGGDLVLGGGNSPFQWSLRPIWWARCSGWCTWKSCVPRSARSLVGQCALLLGMRILCSKPTGILCEMSARVRGLGVRPELEVFDSGQLVWCVN